MKRLYRSRKNRVIAGICGGIAEYLEVDPVLVRLIAVLLLFVGGGSLIAYIIGMIIIPEQPVVLPSGVEPLPNENQIPSAAQRPENMGALIIGIVLVFLGGIFLVRNIPFLDRYYDWFWHMGWSFFWPSVLILIGLLIILKAARDKQNGR